MHCLCENLVVNALHDTCTKYHYSVFSHTKDNYPCITFVRILWWIFYNVFQHSLVKPHLSLLWPYSFTINDIQLSYKIFIFCFQLLLSTATVIMTDISYMTSVNVEIKLNHFNCMICLDILENPVIVNCPCKCIVCEKCISEYWKMQIQEVKRCICNSEGIIASECREAIGLSRIIKNIE